MKSFWLGLTALLFFTAARDLRADTVADVLQRGYLKCGVSQGLPGFSAPDKDGQWRGIDVDYCRALAAAIFGDASKVKFTALSAKERFTALQSREIDILSRNTTWTLQRDASLGLNFVAVMYYDGQGFLVRKSAGIQSARELLNASVCVNLGTTTELNVGDFFRSQGLKYKLVTFEKNDEVIAAYDAGRCDVVSSDQSGLYADRTKLRKPEEHIILPEKISKEPLGPAVRHGDDRWADIGRWTYYALLEAEELAIHSRNVESMLASDLPAVRRLLGIEGSLGKELGLAPNFAYQIIKQVGNYQEIFDRNLGKDSALKMDRGANSLWNQGGLHYAMPFR